MLCLNPIEPSVDPAIALRAGSGEGVWSCFIGGKKIEGGTVLVGMTQEVSVERSRCLRLLVRVGEGKSVTFYCRKDRGYTLESS